MRFGLNKRLVLIDDVLFKLGCVKMYCCRLRFVSLVMLVLWLMCWLG